MNGRCNLHSKQRFLLFSGFAFLLEGWPLYLSAQSVSIKPYGVTPAVSVQSGSTPAYAQVSAKAAPFQLFSPKVSTRSDDRFLYVENNGMPSHQMMVGITAWQQQVPLPQRYSGANAWQIPLNPTPSATPRTIKNQFLRGAVALAVNGIPIFNPQNNRGEVSAEIGELDQWGGHCGRADDYHYHVAPLHLQATVGKGMPIAFALDGYPIFGLAEPDGSTPRGLDAFNGHDSASYGYHYHASNKYPFVNGGFHGEVIERDGQVDPQPRANPVRPALQALRGARITGFESVSETSWKLLYELNGEKKAVLYSTSPDGRAEFEFQNGREGVVKQSYSSGRAGLQSERQPLPGGAGGNPQRNSDPENGPRKPWIQVHGAELDSNNDSIISSAEFDGEAKRTFAGYDQNKDGKLSRDEYAGPGSVRSPMGGFVKEHPDNLDADHDGVITEAEFLKQVRRMFDKLDLNRDGNLSPAEWRDLPPGSPGAQGQPGPPSSQPPRLPQKGPQR